HLFLQTAFKAYVEAHAKFEAENVEMEGN
ncbi:hypothetical protein, partial [Staphylococcus aureus]